MKNIIKNSIKMVLIMGSSLAGMTPVHAHNLTLTLDNIEVERGKLMVALYQGEKSYQASDSPIASLMKPVTASSHSLIFTDLTMGEYAIKVFHDENSNGVLDTNILGIPSEGYGFSNNGGTFGPASFDEAKISVTSDTAITIHIR